MSSTPPSRFAIVYRPRGETLQGVEQFGPARNTPKEAQDYGELQLTQGVWRSFTVEIRTVLLSDASSAARQLPVRSKPSGRAIATPPISVTTVMRSVVPDAPNA